MSGSGCGSLTSYDSASVNVNVIYVVKFPSRAKGGRIERPRFLLMSLLLISKLTKRSTTSRLS